MAIAKDAHSDAKSMKWCCRTCRSRQRRPPTDYKMFDDATPATRPSSTIYENSCGGEHWSLWWWWWLWWYWWWLVSLETTNFWLLLRDKKMIFFSCIWQYPACLPIQGRRGRRRERAPSRLPLFALPLPDHVPPENSFAIPLNTSKDQEMIVYCVCFVLTEFGKLLPIIFLVLNSPI